jgi:hypothetical protein
MLCDSGRLVTVDTANLLMDLEISQSPAREPFKRLHRYVDVMKEYRGEESWITIAGKHYLSKVSLGIQRSNG